MNIAELIIYGLATWRGSSMLVNEVGPLGIFVKIRELAGIRHDSDDEVEIIPDGFLPDVLSCVWCFSWYAGLGWIILSLSSFGEMIALPFALSAVAILLDELISFLRGK